ncbi:MAG: hypothetical protein A2927_00510 [Candidatus Komeilibacteria bacterium RIFCSPLOWO2_01_FULL_45_10]|uniref:HD domain-containing protein n=1 Tax=Candidatus Komeilibacteria bacterium RIFCSPLOWO2_01_FULL_45_10 TaxID=1798550 RepID=A0A1G2BIX0_9BACT|nr:MAG: hypothetical protein A2927_00510 [Candidatus Komeilibacteria bacterium RIFCSPLOWO2_01_FULL_45_10]
MSITKDQIRKIEQFVESKLDSLNWQHTLQVRGLALKLAQSEKADKEIVEAAALFHDVGKYQKEKGHAERSAGLARKYLEKENYPVNFVEEVVYCVICHDYPWDNKPELVNTIEAKVLYDADLISWLSNFGIIKQILYIQEQLSVDFPKALDEIIKKIDQESRKAFTKSGKEEVQKRVREIKNFYRTVL